MIVKESISFERGKDPKNSMKIGLEEAIKLKLENILKIDKETAKIIDDYEIDITFPYVYYYIDNPFLFPTDIDEPERIKGFKKEIKSFFKDYFKHVGLEQYLNYSSQPEVDQIVFKIKPEYRKIFNDIANK